MIQRRQSDEGHPPRLQRSVLLHELHQRASPSLIRTRLPAKNNLRVDAPIPQLTMNHHRRVLQRIPVPLLPTSQEQTAHTRRHAHTERMHRRGDVLHRVVYRQAGRDGPARRVDVQLDWFARVLRLEEEELGREERGCLVVDLLSGLPRRGGCRSTRSGPM